MSDAFRFFFLFKHKELLFLKRTGSQPEKCEFKACLEEGDTFCNLAVFSAYEQRRGYPPITLHEDHVLETPCPAWVSPRANGL